MMEAAIDLAMESKMRETLQVAATTPRKPGPDSIDIPLRTCFINRWERLPSQIRQPTPSCFLWVKKDAPLFPSCFL